ncbi:MAG: glycoside-pentoside-hexuronide (GPH):cation symporter [Clostridiales bacterium]|jgi:probable glucitol transport protein GutA|nr:glycoside-pentoside-hexuronide (GPH):cation symporter [Clostridiales bacterium]
MGARAGFRTSSQERIGFALFMSGQAMFNYFMGTFVQKYFTDKSIAAVAVGTIFLFARVWDAVNDLMFGAILDKAHLKGGKFLPWLRLSVVLTPLAFFTLFAMPESIPAGLKIAWAAVTYLFYDIAYTICDVPIFSMTSAATDNVQERTNIMSRNTMFALVASVVVLVAAPLLYTNPSVGWFKSAVIIAIPAALLMVPFTVVGKERFVNKDTEPVTFKALLDYVKGNRFLLLFFSALTLMNLTNTAGTVAAYFAQYCLNDPALVSVVVACLALPTFAAAVLVPHITKKHDKFHVFLFSSIVSAVLGIVNFFVGYSNLPLLLAVVIIRGAFSGAVMVTQLMFTGDFVEYGEYKTGKRMQGIAYSLQTFTFKFFNAIPAALAMYILGFMGFVEGENAVQSAGTISSIWFLFALFPAISVAISLPVMFRYKLRDKDVQIMASVNSGEMPREEAERIFAGKY